MLEDNDHGHVVPMIQTVKTSLHPHNRQRRDTEEEEASDSESVAVAVPKAVKKAVVTSKW